MSNLTFTGTVEVIGQTLQVSDKFRKREVILSDGHHRYPEQIAFQLSQERCSLADTVKVGDEVQAVFFLTGRKYEKDGQDPKWFNTLELRELRVVRAGNAVARPAPVTASPMPVSEAAPVEDEADDLPF